MRVPVCILPAAYAGALLAAGVAGGCSAAPKPAAQSAAPASAAAPRPSTTILPEDTAGSAPGLHLIEFLAVGRGDRVADLGSGRGYSIAAISQKVGPFGALYVRHDPKPLSDLPNEAASEAPAPGISSNVVRMNTQLDAPFSPEARQLDCATLFFSYHELVAEGRDRQKFNATVFRALKPGGLYFVADHSPVPEATPGTAQAASRVDPRVIRADVQAAGFRFVEAADFLSPSAQASAGGESTPVTSQYVLKFQKPR